ncbi:ATP/GTP-binding protein [Thermogladius sp. 4427co]|uniref:PRK13768 family protein n=1 Tax=Thermogladius sp. 4427co TaxID=3450718 RepID=UPI003F791B71
MPYYIVVIGTAGSGKTTLAGNLKNYLESHQLDAAIINLDPAVEKLSYDPDVDVREYVDIEEVIEKTGLGPNGALIASMDLLALRISDIKNEIESLRPNYFIIDTPGQMELFAFRETGPIILNSIIGDYKRVALFLIDGLLSVNPNNLLSSLFLSASIHARLSYPQINVITKIDLIPDEDLDKILNYLENPLEFSESISASSYLVWGREEIDVLIEKLTIFDTVPVSNVSNEGFDQLYAYIQRILAGGEDYYTEEPNPVL